MARVKYDPWQADQNFQIEDGIRETLRSHFTAEVPTSVIETAYHFPTGTLAQKCETIALLVGAKFSLAGEIVVFETPIVVSKE